MKRIQIIYAAIILITICLGLAVRTLSRHFYYVVNLYLGDILYAFMIFYIVSFIVYKKSVLFRGLTALAICFIIEISQLYQSPLADSVRATLPGRLILGSGFLYSDLLAYFLGVSAAVVTDKFLLASGNIRKGI